MPRFGVIKQSLGRWPPRGAVPRLVVVQFSSWGGNRSGLMTLKESTRNQPWFRPHRWTFPKCSEIFTAQLTHAELDTEYFGPPEMGPLLMVDCYGGLLRWNCKSFTFYRQMDGDHMQWVLRPAPLR